MPNQRECTGGKSNVATQASRVDRTFSVPSGDSAVAGGDVVVLVSSLRLVRSSTREGPTPTLLAGTRAVLPRPVLFLEGAAGEEINSRMGLAVTVGVTENKVALNVRSVSMTFGKGSSGMRAMSGSPT